MKDSISKTKVNSRLATSIPSAIRTKFDIEAGDELEKVREDAVKVFNQMIGQDAIVGEYVENMISPIMDTYINQEYTFVINGDCSKIGWETSKRFHEARMKWCEKHKYDVENIIVINFGEGDAPCYIVLDSKAESEEKKYE